MAKYVLYTAGAALAGGIVGAILGFVALPLFLFKFFALMYTLPAFELSFSPALCALAMGIFVLGIGATTVQSVFDGVLPNMLPLALVFFIYWLFKKKVNVIAIILGIIAFGILMSFLGWM